MYSRTTEDIVVTVKPFYLEDQSAPNDNHYVWAYRVRIENRSQRTVQLLRRHWHITDARGCMMEIRGAGVVGEQPVLHPGETFEYSSGTPLTTPSGIMAGQYEMSGEDGACFSVEIPAFSLDSPYETASVN
ncbi:MAG: ApaG protein [Rhodospirillaceae bacterium]|nr:MAG: ApaG protein [Rhodospirillaceae bacterium]